VWGLLLGAFLQVALQLPGLREAHLRWHFEWWHPAIKRIAFLYAPIVGGLLLNQAVIWVSYNLATQTGDSSVTYMTYATTLYQFPLGLVVMGLSTATLPMLSQQAQGQLGLFRQTLVQGLRLVIILILPATLGLLALAEPIVRLLFEHGQFLPADTHMTTLVLRVYLIGLPFAAVDQMLVYASYARQDTWRPALAGAVSILVYLVVAVVLLRPLGLLSLMAADAVKHIVHTAMMVWILTHQLGHWEGLELPSVLGKGVVSAGLTSLSAYLTYILLLPYLPPIHFLNHLLLVVLPGVSALLVYGLLVKLLNIAEAKMLPALFKRG
jgi:putative peptidoglycan lipid II flippase